ncbi:3-hydroxyacyl-CoA dehydrogenase [Paenibacillus shirakamiensis]|uniref:3-hydroxyacyl-CoA dehydrogenase n=1 Tax=Paenibacillus shirakamiensis TaxID=1265935 RepID=A0ABS4JGU0_9BACL|nr:3-hydroxyacyl-CoA dehydrogenase [Paenibacillus shirakamiensis]
MGKRVAQVFAKHGASVVVGDVQEETVQDG